jgi:hypothetical protein
MFLTPRECRTRTHDIPVRYKDQTEVSFSENISVDRFPSKCNSISAFFSKRLLSAFTSIVIFLIKTLFISTYRYQGINVMIFAQKHRNSWQNLTQIIQLGIQFKQKKLSQWFKRKSTNFSPVKITGKTYHNIDLR